MKNILIYSVILLFISIKTIASPSDESFITAIVDSEVLTNPGELNGVTFGFSAGYSMLHDDIFDYSLSPDDKHSLQQQILSRGSFVISSVVTIKLGKLSVDGATHKLMKSLKPDNTIDVFNDIIHRLSINASLDLINIKSTDLSFNKNINGGLGLGFFITNNVQAALFYDIQNYRQLRDFIVNNYVGKPIPNGTATYTALDQTDNSLFYNKTIPGLSFKIIFSLSNKKSD